MSDPFPNCLTERKRDALVSTARFKKMQIESESLEQYPVTAAHVSEHRHKEIHQHRSAACPLQ